VYDRHPDAGVAVVSMRAWMWLPSGVPVVKA
jgi:hypothetical protein